MSDERQFLERSLADLDLELAAGDISDDDYADLKARYERKLAEAPSRSGLEPAREPASDQDQKPRRWGRTIATVVVVLAAAIGGGLAVARSSGSRKPGETITGSAPSASSGKLADAAALFQQGKISEAIDVYKAILDENPKDVEALTYFGWTLRNVGVQQTDDQLVGSGTALIEKATSIDPTFSQAWFFRGIIFYRDEDKPKEAVDALKLALANDPIPEVESAARELLSEIQQASTSTTV